MKRLVTNLFVYGTLRPGEVRWQHLEPFVLGEGCAATVPGVLYDTGLGYPAATFVGDDRILGRIYALEEARLALALAHLDEVESAVRGRYVRVNVVTDAGDTAWAYACSDPALLATRIECGDWLRRVDLDVNPI